MTARGHAQAIDWRCVVAGDDTTFDDVMPPPFDTDSLDELLDVTQFVVEMAAIVEEDGDKLLP